MEKGNIARTWGFAAALVLAIVAVAVVFLVVASPAKVQASPECCPSVTVQWRPQSILETKFAARVAQDNEAIKNGLQALAKNPGMSREDMLKYVGNTYFKNPRFWTKSGWVEGWDAILPLLGEVVHGSPAISINTVSVVIDYQPFAGAKTPEEDIDAIATIRMTFSASPGDNIMEGTLLHRRVCPIEP